MDNQRFTYLQMIQEVISRMSTASAIFKGFSATIVAGIAIVDYGNVNAMILGLSFVPVILFAFLDVYYLRLERKYRYLYNQVRNGEHDADFSMELTDDNKAAKATVLGCLKSFSISCFYCPLFVILIIIFIIKIGGFV